MAKFKLHAPFKPSGDQGQAIDKLVQGVEDGFRTQVLLGVTGSGKTFTMANVIEKVQRPTLVIAHNKTLAAQLCNEFREFFPENHVEYFVSYYDYYQPEAYIPRSDTYIEKELQVNDEIDRLRNSATSALCESNDVIVVCSVSCIYGLGAPKDYFDMAISLRKGMTIDRDDLIDRLTEIQYKRSDIDFQRAMMRVRGDILEIFPVEKTDTAVRVEFWGDEIDKISEFNVTTGRAIVELDHVNIFPATHYVVGNTKMQKSLEVIEHDLHEQVNYFQNNNMLIEAQRINERVNYDLEMLREMGYCNGVENYSRYFDGRNEGDPPYTLLDFFPKDFLMFIDESHMTIPQIRAMYNGDRSRKDNLVRYGFRLPAAYDNRPLRFEEFDKRISQLICVSATPAPYEMSIAGQVAEQLIRPTGLLDPKVEVRPIEGQIEDLIGVINDAIVNKERVLVTTLTKKMAESLTTYLTEKHFKVRYMHSDIDTLERVDIINGLRKGDSDVLVGINLLREGLDMPEVGVVAILDADKEGFLRSETSLIQTIGRAARNSNGRVIMYADVITDSMRHAIDETNRRRKIQDDYNKEHGIVPKTIVKEIKNTLEISHKVEEKFTSKEDMLREIERLTREMNHASMSLDFEMAIKCREKIAELKKELAKI